MPQNTKTPGGIGQVRSFLRRRPLVAVYCGLAAAYAANAGVYVAHDRPGIAAIWAAGAGIWLGGAALWNRNYHRREQLRSLR